MNGMKCVSHCVLGLLLALPLGLHAAQEQPNILLIFADDVGSDAIGCYGGQSYSTPHIDALAYAGVRFGRFKNTGRCCPSRASLMTGRHQHAVNMGWMTRVDEHRPGYRGQITAAVPTLAEILREKGYGTYMSGKWHLGEEPEHFPAARGSSTVT